MSISVDDLLAKHYFFNLNFFFFFKQHLKILINLNASTTESRTRLSFGSRSIIQNATCFGFLPVFKDDERFWSFVITKDDENPILLESDNFDGTRKAAAPAFLMALLLRQYIKAIRLKTGKKPKEVVFCIVDLDPKDNRVVDLVVEAFKLIKIDVISLLSLEGAIKIKKIVVYNF